MPEDDKRLSNLEADLRRLQPDVPRFGPNDFKRRLQPMRTSGPGKAMLNSGRVLVQIVDTDADRPDDAVDGQLVYVRATALYVWNAEKAGGAAWETV